MEPHVSISHNVPSKYARYRIHNAATEFIEGDFGAFLTQEFITPLWAIGWLNFFIKQDSYLYPTTAYAMVALYSTIEGNIPCVLEGFGELVLQNRKYGFYYIPPEVKNEAYFTPGDYDAVYISFSPPFLAQFIDQHPQFRDLYYRQQEQVQNGQVLPIYQITHAELEILNKIRYNKLNGTMQEIFLQARINDLLVCYFMAHEGAAAHTVAETELERRIRDTASYISHHLHLPLTVSDLAGRANLSFDQFEKQFKRVVGTSPRKYVEELRIMEAAQLLGNTQLSIGEIAFKTGFADANYFSTVFKKIHKMAPKDYRQRKQAN